MISLESLTDVVAVVGGAIAAFKYFSDKRKDRSQSGNDVLEKLESDEKLVLVCRMLDWTARKLPMPKELSGPAFANKSEFSHTHKRMMKALSSKEEYSWDEVAYRDGFDYFLTFLTRVDAAAKSGVYKARDVIPLKYYIDLLLKGDERGTLETDVLAEFMKDFGYYEAVQDLSESLERGRFPWWVKCFW